jgi:hypothetical protein
VKACLKILWNSTGSTKKCVAFCREINCVGSDAFKISSDVILTVLNM